MCNNNFQDVKIVFWHKVVIESIWKNRFQGQLGIAGGGSWTILWYFPLEMKESSVVMQTQSWGFWEFSLLNSLLRSAILSWATLGKVSWTLPHRDMYNRQQGCLQVNTLNFVVLFKELVSVSFWIRGRVCQVNYYWATCSISLCFDELDAAISVTLRWKKKKSTNMRNPILMFGSRIKMLAGKHVLMKYWKTTHHSLHGYLSCSQARHNYGLTISANLGTTWMPAAQGMYVSHFPDTRHFYMFFISITTPTSTAGLGTR